MSKNDDEREDDDEGEYQTRGCKKLLLLERTDKTLKHGLIYFENRKEVKEEKAAAALCPGWQKLQR